MSKPKFAMPWRDRAEAGMIRTAETPLHFIRVYANRIAVSRHDGGRLTWEELQAVKQQMLGDRTCIEIYPAASNVVNLRHTRHLWWSQEISLAVKAIPEHPEFQITEGAQ